MFKLSDITPQTGTEDLFMPLVVRGAVTVLMFLPLSLATLGSLPKAAIASGSGFYNLTRQLGGSIGIALLTTLLQQREAFHKDILLSKISPYDWATNQRLAQLTGAFQSGGSDATTAHQQALLSLEQIVNQQAAVMSYADVFHFVGVIFLCSLPLLLFLDKGTSGGKAPAVH
jgi:DHA2 family multidrug resistance protein